MFIFRTVAGHFLQAYSLGYAVLVEDAQTKRVRTRALVQIHRTRILADTAGKFSRGLRGRDGALDRGAATHRLLKNILRDRDCTNIADYAV